jgi:TPR repeat protein
VPNDLGNIYQSDDEVKDLQKAVNWHQKAADNGNNIAIYQVTELHRLGYYANEKQKGIFIDTI